MTLSLKLVQLSGDPSYVETENVFSWFSHSGQKPSSIHKIIRCAYPIIQKFHLYVVECFDFPQECVWYA